jgi:hypothetical protein
MVTSYVPGGTFAKAYLPTSFVTAIREVFVAVSMIVTLASATAAPDWSVTVPAIDPVPAV